MHGESEVAFALGRKHAGRGKTGVVDESGIVGAYPFGGIWRVRDNGIEWLLVPVIRLEKGVAVAYIEVGIVDVVEEHVDAAEVVGGDVQLLPEEAFLHIVFAENLGKLEQQRAGTAGRVIHLVDILATVAHDARKQFAHLLGSVVFTATLAGIGGIHSHEVLVGIAEDIDLVVLVVPFEVDIANIVEDFGELLIALIHRVAKFVGIHIDVGKKPLEVAFALGADSRRLDGFEHIVEGNIEVGIVLGTLAHIAEQLRREDKETFLVHQLRASRLGFLVGEVGIVEALDTRLGLESIHIIGDIFGYKAVEKDTENVTLEIPAIYRVAKVFGSSPNSLEKFLFLLCACSHIVIFRL